MQVVGAIDVVAACVPGVQVDAAEVDDPEQRREILDHREVDHVARRVRDRAGLDPFGPRRRRALHEERLAVGAVGIALHHHRPVGEVRQQDVGDVGVVLQQVALGDAEPRPERLREVGEPDLAVADRERPRPCRWGSARRTAPARPADARRCAPSARRRPPSCAKASTGGARASRRSRLLPFTRRLSHARCGPDGDRDRDSIGQGYARPGIDSLARIRRTR